jgi:hypothetical protein
MTTLSSHIHHRRRPAHPSKTPPTGLQLASRLSSVASGAVEVGDTVLTISRAQPRVEVQTSLRVFGRDNNIKIRTRCVFFLLLLAGWVWGSVYISHNDHQSSDHPA